MRVAAGVEPGRLTSYRNGMSLVGTQWAPDSRSFLTFKTSNFQTENETKELWRVPVDGGGPTKIDFKVDGGASYRLSPDGRRIICLIPEKSAPRNQEVWALENFLSSTSATK
jgi:hypothetical protein